MTQSENVEEQWVCEISYSDQDLKVLPRTSLALIDDNMPKQLNLIFKFS